MKRVSSTHGAYGRNHPKSIRWMVDFDYLGQLSPEEKEWLAAFADKHYGADFRGDTEWTSEERREAYRRKNAANCDVLTRVRETADDSDTVALESPPLDVGPTPTYLTSAEYQGALDTFRRTLKPGRAPGPPRATAEHKSALAALKEITHGPTEEE